ncbi:MAG: hypothetical protein K2P71_05835, partial [Lachnospiraceae bacterium]|nr:hypothetical protein [Lachnospiraceae bacterium]
LSVDVPFELEPNKIAQLAECCRHTPIIISMISSACMSFLSPIFRFWFRYMLIIQKELFFFKYISGSGRPLLFINTFMSLPVIIAMHACPQAAKDGCLISSINMRLHHFPAVVKSLHSAPFCNCLT